MNFDISQIFELVSLISSIFIFFLFLILNFHPKALFPNRVLSILIFIWSFSIFISSVQSRSFFIKFPHLFGIGTSFAFLYFPLMFLYIKTYLFKEERYISKLLVHFIPFLIFILVMSPFFVLNGEQKVEILQTGLLPWMKDVFYYVDFFIVFLGIFYSIRSFRTIYRFENMTIYRLTDIQLKATKYFKHFLILNAVLWAIGTAGVFIDFSGVNMPFNLFKIYYLGITILTLWISKFTLYRPDLFSINTVVHKEELQNFIGGRPVVSLEDKNIKEKEESNPSINIKEAEIIIEYLETTKSYLDAKITLQKLADAVGLTKNRLSELLNTEIGLSFNDIINEYRVKEVIRLIPRGLHNQHNISYIGELAGFNSKTTFNRTFKKITDKTPSEFIHDNNSKRQNLKTKL